MIRHFAGMLLLFLTVFSVFIGSSADIQQEHQCYGKELRIPFNFTPPVFLGQMFFTPNNGAPTKLIMDNGKAIDPRLKVSTGPAVLTDLTEQDNGTFSVSVNDKTYDIIQLTIDDCAETITKYYGEYYDQFGIFKTEFIEFAPLHSVDQPELMWNRSNPEIPEEDRLRLFYDHMTIARVTQADSGYYNFRKSDGTLLFRKLLVVREREKSHEPLINEHLPIPYPAPATHWTVTFTPKGKVEKITLMKEGQIVSSKFEGRIESLYNGINIRVKSGDSGTLEFRDPKGNLALIVKLKVEEETDPTFIYVAPALGILVVLVISCFCVKKFCFKKRSSNRNRPTAQTAAAPAVYYHSSAFQLQDENQHTDPDYSAAPGTSGFSSQSVTSTVSGEPKATSVEPSVSVLGGQEAPLTPSGSIDGLTSNPEPTFDLNNVTVPLADPLSSSGAVYTSDKLNFL